MSAETAQTPCYSSATPGKISDAENARQAVHPLDPITVSEVRKVKEVLAANGLSGKSYRYSYVMLREPDHKTLEGFAAGNPVPREIGVMVLDMEANIARELVVDVVASKIVLNRQLDPAVEGWGPVLDEDFVNAETITKKDERYIAALAARGVTDLDNVRCVPLSAGVFGYGDEVGRRMIRVLSFLSREHTRAMWAYPIDGIVAHVDLSSRKVLRLIDTGYMHIPTSPGDYLDPKLSGPMRTSLKPIVITQPEGASFTVDNNVVEWENWRLRVGFNGREGLTLHDISFFDKNVGEHRKILNRASVSEMVVPYGEPVPTHEWQNYFDASEYQFGRLANSLELGCDCLGHIQYLDATVVDDYCDPIVIKNAICMHEEDFGTLWKHSDYYTRQGTTRRQRRLVISFFVTVGNYDYGFFWYLYLDGKIELECKATGIVFASGRPDVAEYPYATEMAPRLGAPCHQHLFSARLDFAIDGNKNAVDEIEVERVPIGPENPVGNAFRRKETRLSTEHEAQREADNNKGRVWRISSTDKTNWVGNPTSFVLIPESLPLLLAADEASIRKRAAFATKHLWVTQYERDEMWAAGYTPNQHPGGAGLPAYTAKNRSIDGEDIVVWHTFGLTHFPRAEDWPIMPVDYAKFALKPENFFDRNPTLDVPEDPNNGRKLSKRCCSSNDKAAAP